MAMIICNPTTKERSNHQDNMDKLWDTWNNHANIRNRFSDAAGNFQDTIAESALKDFVEFKLNLPFSEDYVLDPGQVRRLEVEMDYYSKNLAGGWSEVTGIVPEGISKQDPVARKFYTGLNNVLNEYRVNTNTNFTKAGYVADSMLKAYESNVKEYGLGKDALKQLQEHRDKLNKENPDEYVMSKFSAQLQDFINADQGKLIKEFNELVEMDHITFKDKANVLSYNTHVIDAVRHAREHLDAIGSSYVKSLNTTKQVLAFKIAGTSNATKARNFPEYVKAEERINEYITGVESGLKEGGYFPRIRFENMIDIKQQMDKIMSAKVVDFSSEVMKLENDIFARMSTENVPGAVKGRNPAIDQAFDKDPMFVLTQYGKESAAFNKLVHTQLQYLEGMKAIPKADTQFMRGMKKFLNEEYVTITDGLAERPQWVNDFVYTINAFETARTMGFSVTGAIKNAASAIHYYSSVGFGSISRTQKDYADQYNKVTREVEKQAGFLFTNVATELYNEGLISRDQVNRDDYSFNPVTGKLTYQGQSLKDKMKVLSTGGVGVLLKFHQITENFQRKWMFRTAFIGKYKQLEGSGINKTDAKEFAKNFALRTVNSWAYEYAPHAKAKPLRGNWNVVDEAGDGYILAKQKGAGLAGGLSEVAFHLLHYPMSLAETHMSQLKGAHRALLAKQWNADEMIYLRNYAGVFALIQAGSILLNVNLNNILENETLERLQRTERDIIQPITGESLSDKALKGVGLKGEGKSDDKTFGLVGEVTGPAIGHINYLLQVSGIIQTDRSTIEEILFGNIPYHDQSDQDTKYFQANQISTEFGKWYNQQWPALNEGRGFDMIRNWLRMYPASWTTQGRKKLGFKGKKKKGQASTAAIDEKERGRLAALNVIRRQFG